MIAEEVLIQKIHALPPQKISEVMTFVDSLTESSTWRAERTADIASFAAEFAGTEFDLDKELESAGVECLVAIDEAPQ